MPVFFSNAAIESVLYCTKLLMRIIHRYKEIHWIAFLPGTILFCYCNKIRLNQRNPFLLKPNLGMLILRERLNIYRS